MQGGWKNNYTRYRQLFLNVLSVYKTRPDIKSYIEILLSMTTIVIFSLFVIKPTALSIIELNKEIKNKEETLSKLKQKTNDLQTANSLLQTNVNSVPFINQSVPETADIENFVGQVQGLATANSIQILNVSSSEVTIVGETENKKSKQKKLPQNTSSIDVTISATGNYVNVLSFLENIESLRRPIKIDSFALNSSKSDDAPIIIILTGRVPFIANKTPTAKKINI